jgi:hypothetical protein
VVVLCAVLILQIGLCFSTEYTVLPAYRAVYGLKPDPFSVVSPGVGMMIYQMYFCFGTVALMFIVAVCWRPGSKSDKKGGGRETDD